MAPWTSNVYFVQLEILFNSQLGVMFEMRFHGDIWTSQDLPQGSGDDQLHETTPMEALLDFCSHVQLHHPPHSSSRGVLSIFSQAVMQRLCWTDGAWLLCLPSMQEDCSHLVEFCAFCKLTCLPQTQPFCLVTPRKLVRERSR